MKKPKSKRPPRDPEVMKKAWETRRRNQARRADPLARSLGEAHDEYRKRDRDVTTKTLTGEAARNYAAAGMFREAAAAMNETLYGDTEHSNSFLEQYKTVMRYKEYLENLGFRVSYDHF